MNIRRTPSILKQKRTWLIIGLFIILLVVVCLWISSSLRHAEIMHHADKEYTKAKHSAELVSSQSKAGRNERLAAIKRLSTQSIENCEGEWWNSWYSTVLPAAREAAENCQNKAKQLTTVGRAASRLDVYLADDEKVAKTLAVLKISKGSETWQDTAHSSAESVLRDIEAMSVTGDNKELLSAAKDKTVAIVNTWKLLKESSSKQDKAAYLEAEAKLAAAYAELGAISDVSDEQVENLVSTLQAACSKL